jgi:KDO2-lipid IV(A) lauroyltransferase
VALLALAARIVPAIPPWIGYPLCTVLGALVGPRLPIWPRVRANLRVIMPEAHEAEREAAARRVLIHYFKNYFDLFRFHTLTPAARDATLQATGEEHVRAALAQGRGLLMVAPHCGSYTIVFGPAVRRFDTEALLIVEQLADPRLHQLMNAVRQMPGMQIEPLGPAAGRKVLQALRRNQIVVLGGDRAIAEAALTVDLFGRPTPLPSGPAALALRTGAPLMTAFSQRLPDNRLSAHYYPAFSLTPSGDHERDLRDATQKIAYSMQAYIRHDPSQWMVGEEVWPNP